MQRNSVNRKVHLFAQCSSFANAIFADSQFATEMQKSGAQQQQQIPFNFDYFEFTHPFVLFSFTDGTSFEFQLPIFFAGCVCLQPHILCVMPALHSLFYLYLFSFCLRRLRIAVHIQHQIYMNNKVLTNVCNLNG